MGDAKCGANEIMRRRLWNAGMQGTDSAVYSLYSPQLHPTPYCTRCTHHNEYTHYTHRTQCVLMRPVRCTHHTLYTNHTFLYSPHSPHSLHVYDANHTNCTYYAACTCCSNCWSPKLVPHCIICKMKWSEVSVGEPKLVSPCVKLSAGW